MPTKRIGPIEQQADAVLERLFRLVDYPYSPSWEMEVRIFLEYRIAPIIQAVKKSRSHELREVPWQKPTDHDCD